MRSVYEHDLYKGHAVDWNYSAGRNVGRAATHGVAKPDGAQYEMYCACGASFLSYMMKLLIASKWFNVHAVQGQIYECTFDWCKLKIL
jgi:hypothetical protein